MPNKWTQSETYISPQFLEVVRRIPEATAELIEAKMNEISRAQLDLLQETMASPEHLFDEGSFIRDELFPYAVLQSFKLGEITSLRFGTLMKFWGRMHEVLPNSYKPEFIPLFLADGSRNPRASQYLLECLTPCKKLPNLIEKTATQLLNDIYSRAETLPLFDKGIYFTENRTDKNRYTDYPLYDPNKPSEYLLDHTITQEIKHSVDVHPLSFPKGHPSEIVSGFALVQIWLNSAFRDPVRINPVIGKSSVEDIRKCSLERYRDVAVAFPGCPLPKTADNLPAPSSLDYIFHDEYHCLRSSIVTPKDTHVYVNIGDRLKEIQDLLNDEIKDFVTRHDDHKRKLPEFYKRIKNVSSEKRTEAMEHVRKKFNHETSVIATLKRLSLSTGQLKFRIYDMERILSGNAVDVSYTKNDSEINELFRALSNLQFELNMLGKPQGSNPLLRSYSRIIAHAILDVYPVKESILKVVQTQIELELKVSSIFNNIPQNTHQFYRGILEGPVSIPGRKEHKTFIDQLEKKIDYYVQREVFLQKKHCKEKAKLYKDIKTIFMTQRDVYMKGKHDTSTRNGCLESIVKNVNELKITLKINEGRSVIALVLRWIESIAVFFGLSQQKNMTEEIKVSEHKNQFFKSPNTRSVQDLAEIVTEQNNFLSSTLRATV